MVRTSLIRLGLFLWLCFGVNPNILSADIQVILDREVISIQDTFGLTFQVTGDLDDDPDFSPLQKDFRILSHQRRSNFSIINGTSSKTKEWLLELAAKREGDIVIPPISFGRDQSPAKALTVEPGPVASDPAVAQGDDDIFIEVEVSQTESWVQAQIIYTVQLFRSVNTFNSSLSEVKLTGASVITEKLEDRQFEISRNGKRYVVLQRRFALFPQASGDLILEPILFSGQVSQQSRHRFDPFGRNSQTIQRQSRSIELNIKPIPTTYQGKTWLPAKKLELSEKWLKNELELVAGEPVTRTIVIKAEGLTSEQLPEIEDEELNDFKIYPDKPEIHNRVDRDGVTAIRQEKSALIPHKAGEYVLPAIELHWWNTQTNSMEVAHLPERMIKVTGEIANKSQGEPLKQADEEVVDPAPVEKSAVVSSSTASFWPWISLFFALAWMLTLYLFLRLRQQQKSKHDDRDESVSLSTSKAKRLVRNAMLTKDAQQIKNALLVWAQCVWPDQPATSLSELAQRCGEPIATELQQLNQRLYANTPEQAWQSNTLLVAIENFVLADQKGPSGVNSSRLLPLNNI